MTRRSGTRAGGSIIALAIIAGVVVGSMMGEPSIGFLAGAGAGALIATIIWLADRRRA